MSRRRVPKLLAAIAAAATVVLVVALGQAATRPTLSPTQATLAASDFVEITPSMASTPSVALATLQVDRLATVKVPEGLRIWADPESPSAEPLEPALPSGTIVYLTRGPERVGGQDWWEMQPASGPDITPPFGWIRARDKDARPTLVAFVPVCPAVDQAMKAETLRAMGGIAALACFGDATLALEGNVSCTDLVRDRGAGGTSWLDPYSSCLMDEALGLYGPPVTALLDTGAPPPPNPVAGRYLVRGHFDDPEARFCSMLPIGVSVRGPIGPPDPEAVIQCRQLFVVSEVETLP